MSKIQHAMHQSTKRLLLAAVFVVFLGVIAVVGLRSSNGYQADVVTNCGGNSMPAEPPTDPFSQAFSSVLMAVTPFERVQAAVECGSIEIIGTALTGTSFNSATLASYTITKADTNAPVYTGTLPKVNNQKGSKVVVDVPVADGYKVELSANPYSIESANPLYDIQVTMNQTVPAEFVLRGDSPAGVPKLEIKATDGSTTIKASYTKRSGICSSTGSSDSGLTPTTVGVVMGQTYCVGAAESVSHMDQLYALDSASPEEKKIQSELESITFKYKKVNVDSSDEVAKLRLEVNTFKWSTTSPKELIPYTAAGAGRSLSGVKMSVRCSAESGTSQAIGTTTDSSGEISVTLAEAQSIIDETSKKPCTLDNLVAKIIDYDKPGAAYDYDFANNDALQLVKAAAGDKAKAYTGIRPTVQGKVSAKVGGRALNGVTLCFYYIQPPDLSPTTKTSKAPCHVVKNSGVDGYYIMYLSRGKYRALSNTRGTELAMSYVIPIGGGERMAYTNLTNNPSKIDTAGGPTNTRDCSLPCKELGGKIASIATSFKGKSAKQFYHDTNLACTAFASRVLLMAKAIDVCQLSNSASALNSMMRTYAKTKPDRVTLLYNDTGKRIGDIAMQIKPGTLVHFRGGPTGYTHSAIATGGGMGVYGGGKGSVIKRSLLIYLGAAGADTRVDVFEFQNCFY